MNWYDITFQLTDPYDYDAFCQMAKAEQVRHVFTRSTYTGAVNELAVHKTYANTWYDALSARDTQRFNEGNKPTAFSDKKSVINLCCNNDPPSKSMVDLLSRSGYSVAKWVISGFKLVSPEEQKGRLLVCSDCRMLNIADSRCKECGCFVKIKAWMATEDCPLNKWEEIK